MPILLDHQHILRLPAAVIDQASEFRSHFGAMDNAIHEAMLQQEFAGLESFRQVDLAGRLNNSRSGEANQSLRFRDDDIAE